MYATILEEAANDDFEPIITYNILKEMANSLLEIANDQLIKAYQEEYENKRGA